MAALTHTGSQTAYSRTSLMSSSRRGRACNTRCHHTEDEISERRWNAIARNLPLSIQYLLLSTLFKSSGDARHQTHGLHTPNLHLLGPVTNSSGRIVT